jgi:hypothetical protein
VLDTEEAEAPPRDHLGGARQFKRGLRVRRFMRGGV